MQTTLRLHAVITAILDTCVASIASSRWPYAYACASATTAANFRGGRRWRTSLDARGTVPAPMLTHAAPLSEPAETVP